MKTTIGLCFSTNIYLIPPPLVQADPADRTAEVRHCFAGSDACAAGVHQGAPAAAYPAGTGPCRPGGARTQTQGHRKSISGRARNTVGLSIRKHMCKKLVSQ
jgi:hypothetical protein